jgi:hypothetical protein
MFESQYFNVRQDELQKHLLDLRSVANETAEITSLVIMDSNKSLKRSGKVWIFENHKNKSKFHSLTP